jgi:hypothetical protein
LLALSALPALPVFPNRGLDNCSKAREENCRLERYKIE